MLNKCKQSKRCLRLERFLFKYLHMLHRNPLNGGFVIHAYSQDVRDRVLRALERGDRPSDNIARRFEVSRVFVYDVRNRFRDQGERCSYQVWGGDTAYRASRIWRRTFELGYKWNRI